LKETTPVSMEKRILESAEKLFLEKGLALTSTTDIAREAGCNQALVHYYFRTKDRLFEEIYLKKILIFISSFMQIDEENISFEEKLKRKMESHYEMLLENPQLPFLFLNEMVTNPSRIKQVKEKLGTFPLPVYGQFERDLSEEIRKGKIRQVTPLNLILSALSFNIGVFLTKPLLTELLGMDEDAFMAFARERKDEGVRILLGGIRCQSEQIENEIK